MNILDQKAKKKCALRPNQTFGMMDSNFGLGAKILVQDRLMGCYGLRVTSL